jgi:hypothetical protein
LPRFPGQPGSRCALRFNAADAPMHRDASVSRHSVTYHVALCRVASHPDSGTGLAIVARQGVSVTRHRGMVPAYDCDVSHSTRNRTKDQTMQLLQAPAAPAITPLIDLNAQPVPAHYAAPVPVQHPTREAWLEAAIDQFRPLFDAVGAPLPQRVKVTCGWATKTKAIGQAFPRALSAAGLNEVFVSPKLDDAARVLDVLCHELVHVSDDCRSGHKGHFARVARALDMVGALTATTAGPVLKATCEEIVRRIGAYPHAKLDFSQVKKQSTRMIKHECEECGAVWRMAAKWVVVGCPCCDAGRE